MSEATRAQQAAACVGFVVIQTVTMLSIKISQAVTGTGSYAFSPAAMVCASEFVKMCMSASFYAMEFEGDWPQKISAAVAAARTVLASQKDFLFAEAVLGFLYACNNQLQFAILSVADPGAYSVLRVGSLPITALMAVSFLRKDLTSLQWVSIFLQMLGLICVQYDVCKGMPILEINAYLLIFTSLTITSTCGVVNEKLLKGFSVPLNLQNLILYGYGVFFNLTSYMLFAENSQGFFTGFFGFSPLLILFSNSTIGIAITYVYKYANVVVKQLAQGLGSMLMLYISFFFFSAPLDLVKFSASCIVFLAAYVYATAPPAPPKVQVVSVIDDDDVEGGKDSKEGKEGPSKV